MKTFFLIPILAVFIIFQLSSQTIYNENFEGGVLPSGWTQKTLASDGGWKFGNSSSLSSTNFVIPTHTKFACTNSDRCKCNKSNDMLITPVFNFDTLKGKNIQLSFDEYFHGVYYTDGSRRKESAFIKVSLDSGKTWTIKDTIKDMDVWFNQISDFSKFAGDSCVMIAFVYNDMNGGTAHPLYGLSIDNINLSIPVAYDISFISTTLPDCFRQGGTKKIEAEIYSRCAATIDSLTINYQVDNSTIVTESGNSLNFAPGKLRLYTFKTEWNPKAGIHNIKIWVSKINGQPNQSNSWDTLKANENVFQAGKKVLVEYFTQASCYWCSVFDPNLEITVAKDEDFVIGLAYHTQTPGVDPMYNSINGTDCYDRMYFYGITGTPTGFTDGIKNDNLLSFGKECELAVGTEKDTILEVTNPNVVLTGTNLSYSADIVAAKYIKANLKGYVAVIEKEIDFSTAPGTNGQKKFPWVMRKMCPDGNGTFLPSPMNAGDKKTLSGNWTISNIYDKSQLRIIFFVQNTTTKEILWTTMIQPTLSVHENSNITSLKIFPNPANNQVMINFNLEKPEVLNICVSNVLGQKMLYKNPGLVSPGFNQQTLNIDNLPTGSYLIEIRSENGSVIKKLDVIK